MGVVADAAARSAAGGIPRRAGGTRGRSPRADEAVRRRDAGASARRFMHELSDAFIALPDSGPGRARGGRGLGAAPRDREADRPPRCRRLRARAALVRRVGGRPGIRLGGPPLAAHRPRRRARSSTPSSAHETAVRRADIGHRARIRGEGRTPRDATALVGSGTDDRDRSVIAVLPHRPRRCTSCPWRP